MKKEKGMGEGDASTVAVDRDPLRPGTFGRRAFWWNLGATRMYIIESPLDPQACHDALETILQPAVNVWNEHGEWLSLGAPLRKRDVQLAVDEHSFVITDEWRANASAIRDGLLLQGSLEPTGHGTHIPVRLSGRSSRLISTPGALIVFIVLAASAVSGFPLQMSRSFLGILAAGLLLLWVYGYAVASITVGTDALFLVAALRHVFQVDGPDKAAH